MNVAEYAKEKGVTNKEVMAQFGLTHHLQKVPEAEETKTEGVEMVEAEVKKEVPEFVQPEEVVEVKPVARKPVKKDAVFCWHNKRNATFNIKESPDKPGVFVKTANSILKTGEDAVISFLRSHKGNAANGGNVFIEMKDDKPASNTLDQLLRLDDKTLAEMIGGGIANRMKSKGTLIAEIMKIQG